MTAPTTASPYAEFIETLTTVILPVFESFAASSIPAAPPGFPDTASSPSSPGGRGGGNSNEMTDVGSTATAAGGSNGGDAVDGGSLAGGSLAGGSLTGGSLASGSAAGISGGKTQGIDSVGGGEEFSALSVLRVIELETAEDSEVETDVEAARALLPEPLVPAPDPKMVAIPSEKVRQQVRRPAPRMKRPPLQTLEILPELPQEASPPSSRPGSRNATGRAKVEAKAKVEQEVAAPAEGNEKRDGGDVVRAASGALEGNPYRWVVSFILLRV